MVDFLQEQLNKAKEHKANLRKDLAEVDLVIGVLTQHSRPGQVQVVNTTSTKANPVKAGKRVDVKGKILKRLERGPTKLRELRKIGQYPSSVDRALRGLVDKGMVEIKDGAAQMVEAVLVKSA